MELFLFAVVVFVFGTFGLGLSSICIWDNSSPESLAARLFFPKELANGNFGLEGKKSQHMLTFAESGVEWVVVALVAIARDHFNVRQAKHALMASINLELEEMLTAACEQRALQSSSTCVALKEGAEAERCYCSACLSLESDMQLNNPQCPAIQGWSSE